MATDHTQPALAGDRPRNSNILPPANAGFEFLTALYPGLRFAALRFATLALGFMLPPALQAVERFPAKHSLTPSR
jgi:hypothetical protein